MEENLNKITQQISNNLDTINTDNFLKNIKDITEIKECYEISNQFCDTITDAKNKILLFLSEEKEKLLKNKTLINMNLKNTNNDLNKLILVFIEKKFKQKYLVNK